MNSPFSNCTQQWLTYIRRHNANFFDVFFKDLENITDADFIIVIKEIATFFGISVPVLQDKCSTILEIGCSI